MEQEESNAFERELLKVPAVLDMLEDSDRQLINALFYKGISVREYAQRLGISHTMVRKRRDRIFPANTARLYHYTIHYFEQLGRELSEYFDGLFPEIPMEDRKRLGINNLKE